MNLPDRQITAPPGPVAASLRQLPLLTLYVTERCNSRCVTCDYWRQGRAHISVESVSLLLPQLQRLGTEVVVLSGGEPLVHPDWQAIAALLKSHGLKVWLLTAGLSLSKHARRAAALFDDITVSLDGTERGTYAAIRGLDAFDKVCEGIEALAMLGVQPSLRVTLQRSNYRELPRFVSLAKRLGARQVSFLAVDIGNTHAFARSAAAGSPLALGPEDLPVFERLVDALAREQAADFESGFIAESPAKLRRIVQHFFALQSLGPYPPVRCNAPEFSAVMATSGQVQPCFFIPAPAGAAPATDLPTALQSEPMRALRASIRAGGRPECVTCVCSKWRAGFDP